MTANIVVEMRELAHFARITADLAVSDSDWVSNMGRSQYAFVYNRAHQLLAEDYPDDFVAATRYWLENAMPTPDMVRLLANALEKVARDIEMDEIIESLQKHRVIEQDGVAHKFVTLREV